MPLVYPPIQNDLVAGQLSIVWPPYIFDKVPTELPPLVVPQLPYNYAPSDYLDCDTVNFEITNSPALRKDEIEWTTALNEDSTLDFEVLYNTSTNSAHQGWDVYHQQDNGSFDTRKKYFDDSGWQTYAIMVTAGYSYENYEEPALVCSTRIYVSEPPPPTEEEEDSLDSDSLDSDSLHSETPVDELRVFRCPTFRIYPSIRYENDCIIPKPIPGTNTAGLCDLWDPLQVSSNIQYIYDINTPTDGIEIEIEPDEFETNYIPIEDIFHGFTTPTTSTDDTVESNRFVPNEVGLIRYPAEFIIPRDAYDIGENGEEFSITCSSEPFRSTLACERDQSCDSAEAAGECEECELHPTCSSNNKRKKTRCKKATNANNKNKCKAVRCKDAWGGLSNLPFIEKDRCCMHVGFTLPIPLTKPQQYKFFPTGFEPTKNQPWTCDGCIDFVEGEGLWELIMLVVTALVILDLLFRVISQLRSQRPREPREPRPREPQQCEQTDVPNPLRPNPQDPATPDVPTGDLVGSFDPFAGNELSPSPEWTTIGPAPGGGGGAQCAPGQEAPVPRARPRQWRRRFPNRPQTPEPPSRPGPPSDDPWWRPPRRPFQPPDDGPFDDVPLRPPANVTDPPPTVPNTTTAPPPQTNTVGTTISTTTGLAVAAAVAVAVGVGVGTSVSVANPNTAAIDSRLPDPSSRISIPDSHQIQYPVGPSVGGGGGDRVGLTVATVRPPLTVAIGALPTEDSNQNLPEPNVLEHFVHVDITDDLMWPVPPFGFDEGPVVEQNSSCLEPDLTFACAEQSTSSEYFTYNPICDTNSSLFDENHSDCVDGCMACNIDETGDHQYLCPRCVSACSFGDSETLCDELTFFYYLGDEVSRDDSFRFDTTVKPAGIQFVDGVSHASYIVFHRVDINGLHVQHVLEHFLTHNVFVDIVVRGTGNRSHLYQRYMMTMVMIEDPINMDRQITAGVVPISPDPSQSFLVGETLRIEFMEPNALPLAFAPSPPEEQLTELPSHTLPTVPVDDADVIITQSPSVVWPSVVPDDESLVSIALIWPRPHAPTKEERFIYGAWPPPPMEEELLVLMALIAPIPFYEEPSADALIWPPAKGDVREVPDALVSPPSVPESSVPGREGADASSLIWPPQSKVLQDVQIPLVSPPVERLDEEASLIWPPPHALVEEPSADALIWPPQSKVLQDVQIPLVSPPVERLDEEASLIWPPPHALVEEPSADALIWPPASGAEVQDDGSLLALWPPTHGTQKDDNRSLLWPPPHALVEEPSADALIWPPASGGKVQDDRSLLLLWPPNHGSKKDDNRSLLWPPSHGSNLRQQDGRSLLWPSAPLEPDEGLPPSLVWPPPHGIDTKRKTIGIGGHPPVQPEFPSDSNFVGCLQTLSNPENYETAHDAYCDCCSLKVTAHGTYQPFRECQCCKNTTNFDSEKCGYKTVVSLCDCCLTNTCETDKVNNLSLQIHADNPNSTLLAYKLKQFTLDSEVRWKLSAVRTASCSVPSPRNLSEDSAGCTEIVDQLDAGQKLCLWNPGESVLTVYGYDDSEAPFNSSAVPSLDTTDQQGIPATTISQAGQLSEVFGISMDGGIDYESPLTVSGGDVICLSAEVALQTLNVHLALTLPVVVTLHVDNTDDSVDSVLPSPLRVAVSPTDLTGTDAITNISDLPGSLELNADGVLDQSLRYNDFLCFQGSEYGVQTHIHGFGVQDNASDSYSGVSYGNVSITNESIACIRPVLNSNVFVSVAFDDGYTAIIHNADNDDTGESLFVYECYGDHYNHCNATPIAEVAPNQTESVSVSTINIKLKVEVQNPRYRLELLFDSVHCDTGFVDCISSAYQDVVMEAEGANETYLIATHATQLAITISDARERELLVLADDWLFKGALTS